MSKDVRYKGEIIPISIDNYEEWAEKICKEEKIEKHYYHDTYLEVLLDEKSHEFILLKEKLWKINCKEVDFYEFSAEKSNDGIKFDVSFYNGGCSLGEAIESAINSMNKDNK